MVVSSPDRTVSVTEARSKLNSLIAEAEDGEMTHIAVGARVAAHLVPARTRILDEEHVWNALSSALIQREAVWAAKAGTWRGGVLEDVGDIFGRVLGWMWRTDPDQFVRMATDYAGALALAMARQVGLADIKQGLSCGLDAASLGRSEKRTALSYAESHWGEWALEQPSIASVNGT